MTSKGDEKMDIMLYAVPNIPLIKPGDDIGKIVCEKIKNEHFSIKDKDIIVIASKIVSKAEGQIIDIQKIKASGEAVKLAEKIKVDPSYAQVLLNETKKFLWLKPEVVLTEHRLGIVCTKAGIDRSNVSPGKGRIVSLLPKNPDSSAKNIRRTIEMLTGKKIAVIINDTFGRPYRTGSVGMAIGISGISALYSLEAKDLFDRKRHPMISQVDEIAAAASILMGQTTERRPIIIVRGFNYQFSEKDTVVSDVIRPYEEEILSIAEEIQRQK